MMEQVGLWLVRGSLWEGCAGGELGEGLSKGKVSERWRSQPMVDKYMEEPT